MKECINCKSKNRDSDIYCRTCGSYIQSNRNYILINVMIAFLIITILGLVALFVASYMIQK